MRTINKFILTATRRNQINRSVA